MGKIPPRMKGRAAPSVSNHGSAVKAEPHAKAAPRSNLIDQLIEARKAERHSVRSLAEAAVVTSSAIRNLENGKGPITRLIAVMDALPFQVKGLARGRTFADQLRNRRAKHGMSLDALATRTSLSAQEIVELEEGGGSVVNPLRLLAVIAPKVSRHRPERAYWKLSDKVDRDSRFTPDVFMQPVYRAFGNIDLDPCAHPLSPVVARRYFFIDKGDDGLTRPWSGRLAFVNPPYSKLLPWLQRAHGQWKAGKVETILCLVTAQTDSAFFHGTIATEADLYFLRGRVPFSNPAGMSQVTPFSLMVVAFGAPDEQKERFAAMVPGFWIPSSDRSVAVAARGNAGAVMPAILRKTGDHLSIVFRYEAHADCHARISRAYGVACSRSG